MLKQHLGQVLFVNKNIFYVKELSQEQLYYCRLKGKRWKIESKIHNPIVVGDYVYFNLQNDGHSIITELVSRKNILQRWNTRLSRMHNIASNVDQAFLFQSIHAPEFDFFLLDKMLVNCYHHDIPAYLLVNKWDLASSLSEEKQRRFQYYRQKNLIKEIFFISALSLDISFLSAICQDKLTLLWGPSGVGKSTFVNTLLEENIQNIQNISLRTQKGKHTTVLNRIISKKNYPQFIDTAGFQNLNLSYISPYELIHYFPDLLRYAHLCFFSQCQHYKENNCYIRQLIHKDIFLAYRYTSYISLYTHLIEKKNY